MLRAALLLALALPASACPSEAAPEPPPDSESFWEGTALATKPDGTLLGPSADALLSRGLSPARGLIEERRVERGPDDDAALDIVFALTVDAEASTFRVQGQDADGLFDGFGALIGEPWAWTSWEATLEYASGPQAGASRRIVTSVEGSTLTSTEEVRSVDGELELLVERELTAIPADAFAAAEAALLGG